MTDDQAEAAFCRIRWPETKGAPVCCHCGGLDAYDRRRPNGAPRFRCRACRKDFSITSGTLFASHKLQPRGYLAAIALFVNEVKGKSALALTRDLGVSYKYAFVLCHKLREAMAVEMKGRIVGGEGKTVEIDGGYFGGYIKPANYKANRVDRRLARNQNGKRECVVIVRERGDNSVPAVFRTEGAALSFIKARVAKGTVVHADEASSWDALYAQYEVKRINHQQAYSEAGHHHDIAGVYLLRYAQEASWREDYRREANGAQYERVAGLAMKRGPSVDFCGYWQRL